MLHFLLQIADSLGTIADEVQKKGGLVNDLGFTKGDFIEMILRYGFNFLVTFVLIRLIYYPVNKRKDYLLSSCLTP